MPAMMAAPAARAQTTATGRCGNIWSCDEHGTDSIYDELKRTRVKATHDRADNQFHHSGGNSGIQGYAVDPAPITMAQGRGRRYKQRFAYFPVDASCGRSAFE